MTKNPCIVCLKLGNNWTVITPYSFPLYFFVNVILGLKHFQDFSIGYLVKRKIFQNLLRESSTFLKYWSKPQRNCTNWRDSCSILPNTDRRLYRWAYRYNRPINRYQSYTTLHPSIKNWKLLQKTKQFTNSKSFRPMFFKI